MKNVVNWKTQLATMILVGIMATVSCDRVNSPTAPLQTAGGTEASSERADEATGAFVRSSGAVEETRQAPGENRNTDQALLGNQRDQQALDALISEIDRYIVYHPDGSWSVDPKAKLTPKARAFVAQALMASAGMTIEPTSRTRGGSTTAATTMATSGGVRSLTCYWWGCRIGLKSGDAQAIRLAWYTSGVSGAIKVFLGYFAYSGWAASVASVLIPVYAATIWLVDKMGGYRGVFLNVPWSVVPTVITKQ